ncbi:MAG: hypothetical protein LBR30_03055, partial [Clostridioides sp.]|nr:hypothetical protein [Clostridioides sp.]
MRNEEYYEKVRYKYPMLTRTMYVNLYYMNTIVYSICTDDNNSYSGAIRDSYDLDAIAALLEADGNKTTEVVVDILRKEHHYREEQIDKFFDLLIRYEGIFIEFRDAMCDSEDIDVRTMVQNNKVHYINLRMDKVVRGRSDEYKELV